MSIGEISVRLANNPQFTRVGVVVTELGFKLATPTKELGSTKCSESM